MQKRMYRTERGQVLILIALAMIGLLGFTALAIDGGMVYSDRRQAQNAADASALAGALNKANGGTDPEAIQAALDVAFLNNFDPGQVSIQVSNATDMFGSYHMVRADLESDTRTSLMHLFGHSVVTNEVMAVAKTKASGPAFPGMAIIAMGDCKEAGGPSHLIGINGGGNSGNVLVFNGGIFLNSTDPSHSHCAIDPPTSNPALGIVVEAGHSISSVGDYTYPGAAKISPSPINAGVNDGVRIGDPLEGLEEPMCTSNGSESGGVYQPGGYGGSGQPNLGSGTLSSGIYCITGDIHFSGNSDIVGDGVVLYFANGGTLFTGNGALKISAPDDSNCLGTTGERTASCTYKGIAMFMARGVNETFDLRGNGDHKITGTVYALDGDVIGRGGGNDPDEWLVNGQIIARSVAGDGNGGFTVKYNENNTYQRGPGISLTK